MLETPTTKLRPYKVTVVSSPITERYVRAGDTGTVEGNQIHINGVWFDFDERWEVNIPVDTE